MSPKTTPPKAALLVVGSSSVFSFQQTEIKIGRASENDLVIESPNVSRRHARLRYQKGSFEIIDLNSTGGILVNGEKIKRSKLNEGDVITLANVHLVFGGDEFPAAQSTTRYELPDEGRSATQDTTTVIRRGKLKLD